MNQALILLAPPFAHHGRLKDWICQTYGFQPLDVGLNIRAEVDDQTELGRQLQDFLQNGEVIPERFVKEVLWHSLENLSSNRVLFLNFPRMVEQQRFLEEILGYFSFKSPRYLYCGLPEPELAAEAMAHQGHEHQPDPLVAERVLEAIQRYEDRFSPLLGHLEKLPGFHRIDGQRAWDLVETDVTDWLDSWIGIPQN
ncbi:MAG: nucleoside monophosphate kinase [Bacteroidia bacterium]|nr:nucleoside monophosphate kinase [Bacteroidia bacterium]